MIILKIIGSLNDLTRIRILNILRERPLCVMDIEKILDLRQTNATRHLQYLHKNNLLIKEKKSRWVFYGINHTVLDKHQFIQTFLETSLEDNIFTNDRLKLFKHISTEEL